MRSAIALIFLLFTTAVHAVCLNPFGCEPSNNAECIADATRRPTELGVRIAKQQCYERFVKPEEQRREKAAQDEAERLAKAWATSTFHTVGEAIKVLGNPSDKSGPLQCESVDGKAPPSGTQCFSYEWVDARAGRICPSADKFKTFASQNDLSCRFRLQALTNSEGTLWAWWRESY